MNKPKDLSPLARELREATGETQAEFGRRIKYGLESIQRFEDPKWGVSSPRALVAYAELAHTLGNERLFDVFSGALIASFDEHAFAVLRRAISQRPDGPGAMDVPPSRQPLVRRLLILLDKPASDVEARLGSLIIDLLDPQQDRESNLK